MAEEPTKRKWGRAKSWLAQGALMIALVVAIGLWQARAVPSGMAPPFQLQSLAGAPIDSQALRGKPALLVFWAPWCGVCRLSSRNVSWLRTLVGESAHVVSIASHYQSQDEVRSYVAEQQVDYTVLLDEAGTARKYGVRAYPTLVFLDANGHIRSAAVGYTTTLGMYLRLKLAGWL